MGTNKALSNHPGVMLGNALINLSDAKIELGLAARFVEPKDADTLNDAKVLIDQAMKLIRPIWYEQTGRTNSLK